jgi:hypothetical protein
MWQVVRQVLTQAWQQFAGQSLAVLPNVLAGLLFLVIGIALTMVARRVAKFLRAGPQSNAARTASA